MQIIEVKNQLVSTIALIDDENKILIGKRPVGKVFENLWEFPGGKVKKNETVEQALIREIKEEINIDISKNCVAPLTFASDNKDRKSKILLLYVCRKWEGFITSLLKQKIAWVKPVDLGKYKMPDANLFLNSILRNWVGNS